MKIDVYGKPGCAKCKSTKEKLAHYLKKWNVAGTVPLEFVDMESPDGNAQGAFYDVYDVIPVTIVMGAACARVAPAAAGRIRYGIIKGLTRLPSP